MTDAELVKILESVLYRMVDPPAPGDMKQHWLDIHQVYLELRGRYDPKPTPK